MRRRHGKVEEQRKAEERKAEERRKAVAARKAQAAALAAQHAADTRSRTPRGGFKRSLAAEEHVIRSAPALIRNWQVQITAKIQPASGNDRRRLVPE